MGSGPDLRIQNSHLHVENIKPLKAGLKVTAELTDQLKHDGLDSVIFQKGDQLFIAYKKNMDLSRLKLNDETFNPHTTNDQAGQLFLTEANEPVKVLFVDDENQDSFWTSPYKAVAGVLDDPSYKAGAAGFFGGVVSGFMAKSDISSLTKMGTRVGLGVGVGVVAIRSEAELSDDARLTGVFAGTVGFGAGHLAGRSLDRAMTYVKNNPKVAISVAAGAVAVVGVGLAMDALTDRRKIANYSVINQLTY